ncbi:MAG: DNA primase [Proteobacteria bacterium]|nr:DNA primase [Pseudomonadota bacterium]
MPFIPDDKIEEIRACCSILAVVSAYVSLKKAGRNYVGLCPFHAEKTPSFTVSEEKGIFHCFGCGVGGNVFTFLAKMEGKSFPEVARELAEKEGIDLPDSSINEKQSLAQEKADKEKKALLDIHEEATSLYNKLLMRSSVGERARNYLKERGLDSETAKLWQLGYGGNGWSTFSDTLKADSSERLAETAGLIIKGKKGGYYDRFRERLIFPICDLRGRTVAFGGRAFEEDGPKYMNSPESPLYSKGKLLYGLNKSKDAIREANEAIVVEGYMDLLSLYQSGIKNVVATLGTALTSSQALLLRRFCKRVVLFFDSDEAGLKAAIRGIEVLLESGASSYVLTLPEGEDPDSYVRKKGADLLNKEIINAKPTIEFLLEEKLKKSKTSSPADRAIIIHEIKPYLRKIEDRLERSLTVKKIAERMGVDEQLILDTLSTGKGARPHIEVREVKKGPAKVRVDAAEEIILDLMMSQGEFLERVVDLGLLKYFRDKDLQLIGKCIEDLYENGREVSPSILMGAIDDEEIHKKISSISMKGESLVGFSAMEIFQDCEKRLRDVWQLEEEKRLNRQLEVAKESGDEAAVTSLLEKKQELFQSRKKGISQKENING